jgi:hypothetical protein
LQSFTSNHSSGESFSVGTTAVIYTATDIHSNTSTCTFNVIVHDPPTVNAGSDQIICYTGTATVTATLGGEASSVTWSTSGDGSFDDNTQATAIYSPGATDIINGSVTLSVFTNDPSGPCGASGDNLTLVIQNSFPNLPGTVTPTATTHCQGDVATYSLNPVAGALDYTWNVTLIQGNAHATIQSGQGTTSISVLFNGALPTGQSFYAFTVTANNSCGSSLPRSFSVRNKISVPSFTSSLPSVVCNNSSNVVYSVNPVAGATSYSWSISGAGASISGPTNGTSINVNFTTYSSITISVTATNPCMTTTARTMTVNSAPLTPGSMSGISYPCPVELIRIQSALCREQQHTVGQPLQEHR